jgi:hypothetical protein
MNVTSVLSTSSFDEAVTPYVPSSLQTEVVSKDGFRETDGFDEGATEIDGAEDTVGATVTGEVVGFAGVAGTSSFKSEQSGVQTL